MEQIIKFIGDNTVLIANIVALIAMAISFASYQLNSQRKLLVMQIFSNLLTGISFMILGAWTGVAMNCIAIIRNIVYSNKRAKSAGWIPFAFAAVMIGFGIATWTEWYCVLMVVGWVVNTLSLSSPSPQFIRKSILVSSPLACVYSLLARNYLSAAKETMSMISAIIGIIRFSRNKKE
ncbi:MAG: YgjV family protein [Ruminococcaceae bacterium]|nr:YgjV family protein [Oscillospiraceae bacterium]